MAISYRYKLNRGFWVSVSNAQACSDRPRIDNVHSYLEIDSLNIPAGEEFTFWQFPQENYSGSPVGWTVQGPVVNASLPEIPLNLGIVSDVTRYGDCTTGVCVDSSECPEGEKCVNGECVPCDEQQATHFQIRAEFEELVTLPDGSQTMYLLSSVYPIGSGVSNQIIQLAECNGVWYYPRIRFCDASGVIKPYTGAFAFYGYCNPDGSTALWVNNFNAVEQSHFLGQRAQMDLHFASPLSVPRILVEFIEPSAVILESDCSSVTPEDPPDIEPVEPDDPEEPDEPIEPDDPEEPDEPDKPTPPPQPQEGLCPCEEYIGLQIKRAADILYDGLILLKRELSVIGREIVVELWEKRKMDYQLSMFLQNQQFQIMQAQHLRLYEIRQVMDSLSSDVSIIKDSLRLQPCEPDYPDGKTIAEIADDFEKHYYPTTVEVLENDVVLDTGSDEPDIFCRKLRN